MCIHMYIYCCCSVAKSCPHCLQPHELQHARLPCPSPSSGVCLNTYLLNQWWLPIISSSVTSFPSCLQNLSNHQSLFQWVGSSYQVAKVLKLQLHRQSFQWMFRVDFLQDWLVWSPCCPKDFEESSPAQQFESIISLALSLLYSSPLWLYSGNDEKCIYIFIK